jgi:hypothetical protein
MSGLQGASAMEVAGKPCARRWAALESGRLPARVEIAGRQGGSKEQDGTVFGLYSTIDRTDSNRPVVRPAGAPVRRLPSTRGRDVHR